MVKALRRLPHRVLLLRFQQFRWRGVSVLVMCVVMSIGFVGMAPGAASHAASQAPAGVRRGVIAAGPGRMALQYQRTVDFAQFKGVKPTTKARPFAQLPARWRRAVGADQQQTYQRTVEHMPGLAQIAGQPMQGLLTRGIQPTTTPSPTFDACAYSDAPCKQYGFAGPTYNSIYSGGGDDYPPYWTVAANPSYVLVSDGFSMSVYTFSGTLVSGWVDAQVFFGVMGVNVSTFVSPVALTWDATRGHWVMALAVLQIDDFGNLASAYYAIAVSVGDTPTLEDSTKWNLFYVGGPWTYNSTTVYCVGPGPSLSGVRFGSDYWGLWLTCDMDTAVGAFENNAVLVVNKNQLYTGQNGNVIPFFGIPSGVSCGSGCLQPANNFMPALEDGTPDAEFLLATDAGFGGPFSDLTTVAFTNTRAITQNLAPTASYVISSLPQPYADPANASQPGQASALQVDAGVSFVQYRGGDLFTAWTTPAVFGGNTHDGAYWLDEEPQLTALDPAHPGNQQIALPILRNSGIYGFTKSDAYAPTLMASSEQDMTLLLTVSSNVVTVYPSVLYAGRRATDAPGVMGVNGTYGYAMKGTANISFYQYEQGNGCSLDTNLTTRGLVWCIGQYGGPDPYDSTIAGLRME